MTEERTVSTSLGLPIPMCNSHSPFSLHHCLRTCLTNDMCKSHSTCTLSLRTFSHMFPVGCQYPSAWDLTWIFFVFWMFWAPESDVTLLFLHIWAIIWNAKIWGLHNINFENVLDGVLFCNIRILLFFTQVFPPSLLPSCLALLMFKTCLFWYQGGSSNLLIVGSF